MECVKMSKIEKLNGRSILEIAQINSDLIDNDMDADMITIVFSENEFEENIEVFKSVIDKYYTTSEQKKQRLEQVYHEVILEIDFAFWIDADGLYFES